MKRRAALQDLFEHISPSYDRLNHWLSAGLDRRWRAWAAREIRNPPAGAWVDLASGTGDLAAALREAGAPLLVRIDLSAALLRLGAGKLKDGGADRAPGVVCEMDRLPFRDGSLGAAAQGFALRHCREFGGFFGELLRVLRPGGRLALLDMRVPRNGPGSGLYRIYFLRLLPRIASVLGGRREAYEMMVESVRSLPPEEELERLLSGAGFVEVRSRRGFLGAVALLTARRP